ncbi:succinate-semialdehyde dehydrogenase [Pseudomonas aeruginosa]|nr:succinate-semialdehyde dehydrogenase [Pseudomonas aeruginosa]
MSFTGSTRVGKLVLQAAAQDVKKVALELGGNAPFIVLPDADLEQAVKFAINAKFQTSGQDCCAANRILVARESYEPFLKRFAAAVRELRVGPASDPRSEIGPLMHQAAFAATCERVRDAIDRGARLLAGGEPHALGGWFHQPTLLADVTPAMRIWREENFAPIAGVTAYDDLEQAVELANASEYGLAAYICGQRLDQVWPLMRRLEFAMVAVNGARFTGHPIPFGGMKASGLAARVAAKASSPSSRPNTSACITAPSEENTAMTDYAKLFEQDRAHLMHPSTHAHDHASGTLPGRIITGASGVRIRDQQGRELLDAFAGLYCVNIGYGRLEVADAIHEQAKRLAYYHTYVGHSSEAIIELSARIIRDWAPAGMKKVYYGLSGSDANETQVKLVRYYNNVLGRPQKKKIISRQRGYHGSGIVTGSLTGLASFHQHFDLPVEGVKHTLCPHFYKAPAAWTRRPSCATAPRNWRS